MRFDISLTKEPTLAASLAVAKKQKSAPYMEAEVGRTGLEVLRAVKEQLDPHGIMNPGKLLG